MRNIYLLIITISIACALYFIVADTSSASEDLSNNLGGYYVSTDDTSHIFSYIEEGYTLDGELIVADYSSSLQMGIISDRFIAVTYPLNMTRMIFVVIPGQEFISASSISFGPASEESKENVIINEEMRYTLSWNWIAYSANDGEYIALDSSKYGYLQKNKDVILGSIGNCFSESNTEQFAMIGKGGIVDIAPKYYCGENYEPAHGRLYYTYGLTDPLFLTSYPSVFMYWGGLEYCGLINLFWIPLKFIPEKMFEGSSLSTELDVFLLIGQSNGAYFKENVEVANEEVHLSPGSAYYYGSSSKPEDFSPDWKSTYPSYNIYPMSDSFGTFRIGSLESSLASHWCQLTSHKTLIINTCRGGTSIYYFQPGEFMSGYISTLLYDCLSKIPDEYNINLKSIIFVQGEEDRFLDQETYITQFNKAYTYFKTLSFEKFVMSKVRCQYSTVISSAQSYIASGDPNILLSSIPDEFNVNSGTIEPDELHYSQRGRNILGGGVCQNDL